MTKDARSKRFGLYAGRDPRDVATYGTTEVARYLRIPFSTVRNWTSGYPLQNGRPANPMVRMADAEKHMLSFWNVAELHVLDSMRRYHGIPQQQLRRLIRHLEEKFDTPHPLINERMFTDGLSVMVEKAGRLVNATRDGQIEMRQMIEAHLQRIEVDTNGLATTLFPFVRRKPDPNIAASLDDPRLISIDPRIRFGRPVIAGTGIPTAEIVSRFRAGDSFAELAEEYGRTQLEIEEAIRCEFMLDEKAA